MAGRIKLKRKRVENEREKNNTLVKHCAKAQPRIGKRKPQPGAIPLRGIASCVRLQTFGYDHEKASTTLLKSGLCLILAPLYCSTVYWTIKASPFASVCCLHSTWGFTRFGLRLTAIEADSIANVRSNSRTLGKATAENIFWTAPKNVSMKYSTTESDTLSRVLHMELDADNMGVRAVFPLGRSWVKLGSISAALSGPALFLPDRSREGALAHFLKSAAGNWAKSEARIMLFRSSPSVKAFSLRGKQGRRTGCFPFPSSKSGKSTESRVIYSGAVRFHPQDSRNKNGR